MDIKEKFLIMLEQDIKINLKDEDNYFIERKFVRKYGKSAKGVYSHISSLAFFVNSFKALSEEEIIEVISNNGKKFKPLYDFICLTPNAIKDLKAKGPRKMADIYLDLKRDLELNL